MAGRKMVTMINLPSQVQEHARTEELIERAIKALRVELEATLEAAKRIEELVARLRARKAANVDAGS
jgi:hypothetical protein